MLPVRDHGVFDSNDVNYCNKATYVVAFIEIITTPLLIGVLLLLFFFAICLLCVAPPDDKRPGVNANRKRNLMVQQNAQGTHYKILGHLRAATPGIDLARKLIERGKQSSDDVEMQ